jgi:hypothetical protein
VDGPRSRKIGAAAKIIREKAAAAVAADDDLLVFSIGFCPRIRLQKSASVEIIELGA